MKPRSMLIASAVYLIMGGLGFLVGPESMSMGALPAGSSGTLTAILRGYGGMLLAIGLLNLLARNSDASKARDAIFLGNTVGFGCAAITAANGALGGGAATLWILVVVDLTFAVWFFVVGKASMSLAPK